jgi:hypothetical protein
MSVNMLTMPREMTTEETPFVAFEPLDEPSGSGGRLVSEIYTDSARFDGGESAVELAIELPADRAAEVVALDDESSTGTANPADAMGGASHHEGERRHITGHGRPRGDERPFADLNRGNADRSSTAGSYSKA